MTTWFETGARSATPDAPSDGSGPSPADPADVVPERPDDARTVPPSRPPTDASASEGAWTRPALIALLVGTGLAYLINLNANGWANAFYSAAVQAGSKSWEAFFFGSLDAANAITVDKPPASLWVMELSVRVFGLNSWSILVPQVLMAVAAVAVLYATVKRAFGARAGLLAGLVLALTPVAVLMFRFNNPDALLTLLMTLAAWATLRAIEEPRLRRAVRWMVIAGVFLGFGFLTKTLQVMLVVPALGLAWLVAARATLSRRLIGGLAGIAAMIVAAGWWVAIVELVPASMRPYIGGSQTNSFLELTFGYNGLGRLSGDETGSVVGGGGRGGAGGGMWGETGLFRLFDASNGGQISWLIPSAVILLVAGIALRARAPRTDLRRAGYIVWGGWLIVTLLTFSFMAGIFHQYYSVALAPAVAALIGMGGAEAWQQRRTWLGRAALALASIAAGIWGFQLLSRTTEYPSVLRYAVLLVGVLAGIGLLWMQEFGRRVVAALAGAAVIAGLTGPAAYSVTTISKAYSGSIVTAGPNTGNGFGGGGPGGGFGQRGQRGQFGQQGQQGQFGPPGQFGGQGQQGAQGQTQQSPLGQNGTQNGTQNGAPGGTNGGTAAGPGGGGPGGLLDASTPSADVVAALEQNASRYTWVAAAVGSQSAAGLQLATQLPVMAIGGFNGSDPSPTLAQFQQYVAEGKIHYFAGGGRGFGQQQGGSQASSEIASWVQENFTAVTVGSTTLYDLTQPLSGANASTASAVTGQV